jgi:hypothetical protein
MIAPVDRRGALYGSFLQTNASSDEIRATDAESMMAAAKWMLDAVAPLPGTHRFATDLEQREVLIAALQQCLMDEMRNHSESEHFCIKALGTRKVADLDTEMVETFEFH